MLRIFAASLEMREHAARGFERRLEHVPHLGADVGVAVIADGNVIHVPN